MNSLRKEVLLRNIARNLIIKRTSASTIKSDCECYVCTMDELPVPGGSWYSHHAMKNRLYNRVLLIGILSFGGMLGYAMKSGRIILNLEPYHLDPYKEC